MRTRARGLVAAAVALTATFGIAALSRVPFEPAPGEGALIRFSWRTPGAFVEECRRLSAEELERLPVHMRREQVCEGRIVPYRLHVALDGRTVFDETVRAAGAREDRPLYVFRELPVAPGEYRVRVRWEQEGTEPAADPDHPEAQTATPHREAAEAAGPGQPAAPPVRLVLDATLRLAEREVTLITYDLDERVLVARGPGTAAAR